MTVTYYLPAPRQNTGETQAKSSPNQGTRAARLWQTVRTMTDRLTRFASRTTASAAALCSTYRATVATAAMLGVVTLGDRLFSAPYPTEFRPAAALLFAVLTLELHRSQRSRPRSPRPAPRFSTAYVVAAVGGGYYGVAFETSRKRVFGPKRGDRHVALSDLHRLLEELDKHAQN